MARYILSFFFFFLLFFPSAFVTHHHWGAVPASRLTIFAQATRRVCLLSPPPSQRQWQTVGLYWSSLDQRRETVLIVWNNAWVGWPFSLGGRGRPARLHYLLLLNEPISILYFPCGGAPRSHFFVCIVAYRQSKNETNKYEEIVTVLTGDSCGCSRKIDLTTCILIINSFISIQVTNCLADIGASYNPLIHCIFKILYYLLVY